MAQSLIPPPSKMDTKGDLVNNWQYFRNSWSNYEIAIGLADKPDTVRVATLLSIMGKECYQVYENLPLTEAEIKNPADILKKLGEHFEPQRNTIYERYVFNSATQDTHENIEQYLNRLRKLASTCNYGELLDEMLRDRLVIGIRNNPTRARLLRESKLTLAKALDISRSSEATSLHLQAMEKTEEKVHQLKSKPKTQSRQQKQPTCKYCGESHQRGKCPAFGQE